MSLSSPSDSTPIIDGSYAASRSAWLAAKAETLGALEKMKASINKTKDPRAAQVCAALERVVRRIPDAGCALDALAYAEDNLESNAAALKENARKTAQLASYYLRSDRLVAMVRENPFGPVSVDKIFNRALQIIQRELK
jgi:hypothetical protein